MALRFPYISCWGSIIWRKSNLEAKEYFHTSHVEVLSGRLEEIREQNRYFHTSHVEVLSDTRISKGGKGWFPYISCWGSISYTFIKNGGLKKFPYISCWGSIGYWNSERSCQGISIHLMLRFYPLFTCPQDVVMLISIHLMLRFYFIVDILERIVKLISIHLMLRFYNHTRTQMKYLIGFPYISCWGSICKTICQLHYVTDFHTSHVEVLC